MAGPKFDRPDFVLKKGAQGSRLKARSWTRKAPMFGAPTREPPNRAGTLDIGSTTRIGSARTEYRTNPSPKRPALADYPTDRTGRKSWTTTAHYIAQEAFQYDYRYASPGGAQLLPKLGQLVNVCCPMSGQVWLNWGQTGEMRANKSAHPDPNLPNLGQCVADS